MQESSLKRPPQPCLSGGPRFITAGSWSRPITPEQFARFLYSGSHLIDHLILRNKTFLEQVLLNAVKTAESSVRVSWHKRKQLHRHHGAHMISSACTFTAKLTEKIFPQKNINRLLCEKNLTSRILVKEIKVAGYSKHISGNHHTHCIR